MFSCWVRQPLMSQMKLTGSRMMMSSSSEPIRKTHLAELHAETGGKMVEFCGWSMPLQFGSVGVIQSVVHTRKACTIFDVSHMLQVRFTGSKHAEFIERLIPTQVHDLPHGRMAYSNLLNRRGGVIDDCIVTKYSEEEMIIVVNAGCADKDWAHFQKERETLGYSTVNIDKIDESLIAVQGPQAEAVLQRHVPGFDLSSLRFMNAARVPSVAGVKGCRITRCGYTGEDGFEISVPHKDIVHLTRSLYAEPEVLPGGLAARDVLRLEAMLPLYGNDLNEDITPIEANLNWIVSPSRRLQTADSVPFLGDTVVRDQLANGTWTRRRQGFSLSAIARSHAKILDPATGSEIGEITSGTFSPILQKPIAMGYVAKPFTKVGTKVNVDVRGKVSAAEVTSAKAFVPNTYKH